MRLAAVYIPQNSIPHVFGINHSEQTINLGGKYLYKLSDGVILEKTLNPTYIAEFWKPVDLVSAIVGANGTGKSSLLNLFRAQTHYFCVYENDEDDSNEVKKSDNLINDFIYYTPHFEPLYDGYENENFRDVSKFPLMIDDAGSENNHLIGLLELHYSENLKRWIKFTNELVNFDTDVDLPTFEFIQIKINQIPISENQTSWTFRDFFHRFKEIESKQRPIDEQQLIDRANLAPNVKGSTIIKQLRLKYEILSRVIDKTQNILENSGNKFLREGYINNNWNVDSEEFTKHNSDLKESFYWFLDNAFVQISPKADKIYFPKKEISELIEVLFKHLPPNDRIDNWTEMVVSQDAGLEILKAYEQYILSFKDNFSYDKKILLTFSPNKKMSSGERGMYNLFSSFLDVSYRFKNQIAKDYFRFYKKNALAENIIILLDEGDLGFHPIWKKKYIDLLIKIFPKIFEGKNLQIIIATHDPLTLSDIPNNNITYLLKSNDHTLIVNKAEQPDKSFGANITDLLADSFFISNGLIGEFAKEKIDTVIKWLNKKIVEKEIAELKSQKEVDKELLSAKNQSLDAFKTIADLDKDYVVKLITIIDEPLLRYKLEEMYYTVYPKEINREEVIAQIQHLAKNSGLNVNFDEL